MPEVLSEKYFSLRVKEIIREVGSAEKLARMTGMSSRVIGQYAAGTSDPTRGKMVALAVAAGFNVLWLATGEGPKRKEGFEEKIPVQVSPREDADQSQERYAGTNGHDGATGTVESMWNGSNQSVDYIHFKPEWIDKALGTSSDHVVLIKVKGDSMEPTLSHGDIVLVDTTDSGLKNDSLYVLQSRDLLLVKRIQYKTDGTVLIKSDNKMYESETISGDKMGQLDVVGRVVWYGRIMK